MRRLKEIFRNLYYQKYGVIFGLIVGLVIATGISYGVNSITSEGVSYKKSDGTTVSVKQALDDVINKSLTRIEFLEKWLASNTGLSLEQIKNTNKLDYLADVVQVGDYVAYDAGSWTETKAKPTSHGQFGGYTISQNKANSVSWCLSSAYATSLKGWRVYSINKSTKTVTLIHAGQPECYYHGTDTDSSITNLNNRANTYLNSNYANSVHMMNYNEALAITGSISETDNNLRKTGDYYWLATSNDTDHLWYVNPNGLIDNFSNSRLGSVRPVVVLKSNIKTTGLGTDKVGQGAWTLVKP